MFSARSIGLEVAKGVLGNGALKVVFSSPTLLRDLLRPTGKYKSYFPSLFTVFATPVYTVLHARECIGLVGLERRLFNETYSALGGVRIRWVYYGRRPEPALVGYVNYRVNGEYKEFLEQGLNVEEWLGEIFAYALTLGIGAGRATGFGHVELRPFTRTG